MNEHWKSFIKIEMYKFGDQFSSSWFFLHYQKYWFVEARRCVNLTFRGLLLRATLRPTAYLKRTFWNFWYLSNFIDLSFDISKYDSFWFFFIKWIKFSCWITTHIRPSFKCWITTHIRKDCSFHLCFKKILCWFLRVISTRATFTKSSR